MQQDRPPSGYPTTDWKIGEQIRDVFVLAPADCGACRLIMGFYDPVTLVRLGEGVVLWD